MYAVTDPDCEEDANEAKGAESSCDEGEDAGPGEVHSEPKPPPPQTKILYETAYNTSLNCNYIGSCVVCITNILVVCVFVYMKLFCSGARRPMAYVPCGHS